MPDKRMLPDRGTAVITGAASGLGREFALALAVAGHDIAILDLRDATETATAVSVKGVNVWSCVGDASDPDTVATFVTGVRDRLRPVRVVVNNVGISPYLRFDDTDLSTWHHVLRVNLDSTFLITQAFLPDLRAHGMGRIVNLTSTVVWDAQAREMAAYATSKAAIVGLTRALAGELGVDGITVNAIAPGIVLTNEIIDRVPDERLELYRQRQAIPVLATPADLVPALLYLIDEASGQVTGSVVPVNGGRVTL